MLLENRPYPEDLRVRREANALCAAGYHVTVICPADKGQPSRETVDGVSVYRYPAPPDANGLLAYVWEYGCSMFFSFLLSVRVFFAEGFDIVHAHNPPDTFVFIAVFYKLFGKRFVYDHHDLSPEMYQARFAGGGNLLVYRALVWLEKLSCYFADHVIVTNESYKTIARERCSVPESRITIVRNGVELNRLAADIEPRQQCCVILGRHPARRRPGREAIDLLEGVARVRGHVQSPAGELRVDEASQPETVRAGIPIVLMQATNSALIPTQAAFRSRKVARAPRDPGDAYLSALRRAERLARAALERRSGERQKPGADDDRYQRQAEPVVALDRRRSAARDDGSFPRGDRITCWRQGGGRQFRRRRL